MKLVKTADGSYTLFNLQIGEHYHSINGALSESMHVFIEAGFNRIEKDKIKIFEVGFGTGLNAFLTLLEARKKQRFTVYHAIELYPVDRETYEKLALPPEYSDFRDDFVALHRCSWDEEVQTDDFFRLKKIKADLTVYDFEESYDLVYFDAFSYDNQPEMWSQEVFDKIYRNMNKGGILVTYSAKGVVKRALRNAGFEVERLPGALGKRHMVRATKN